MIKDVEENSFNIVYLLNNKPKGKLLKIYEPKCPLKLPNNNSSNNFSSHSYVILPNNSTTNIIVKQMKPPWN